MTERLICVFVLFLMGTLFSHAQPPRQELPLTVLESGHFAVPIRVNGEGPFLFLLDTGAESTAIFRRLAVDLLLPQSDSARVMVMGLNGPSMRAVYEVGELGIGEQQVRLARTFVLENSVVAERTLYGVLGADVLLRFVVEVDQKSRLVRFHGRETDLDGPGSPWQSVAIEPVNGRLVKAEVELDGEPMLALLDTGSPVSTLTPLAAALIDPDNTRAVPGNQILSGIHGGGQMVLRISKATLQVGGTPWPAGDVLVADLPVLASLGWRDKPAMIIGANMLGQRRFAIDYADKRFLFLPEDVSAAP